MKFKDSRIDWIGEIPSHWEVSKIKYQTYINKHTLNDQSSDDYIIQYIDIGNVNSEGQIQELQKYKFNDAPSRARRIVKKNDLLISTVRTYLKAITSILYDVEENVICSTGFAVLTPKNTIDPLYLHYLSRSEIYIDQIVSKSTGVSYPAINASDIGALECILPPLDEQQMIGKFLYKNSSEVESIIQLKLKYIMLLKQQRQSIITEAVTKGLNPNVKMKDSGVDWIGEIPEHWEVRKIKDVGNVYSSNIDKKSVEGEEEVFLCNYVDVYYNDSITANLDFMKATAKVDQIKTFTLKKHDVIITKDSESPTDIAIPTWVSQDLDGVVCGYHLSLIRCAESVLGHYLYYTLESVQIREQFYTRANGVTRYGLSKEAIKNGLIAVPPYNEQLQIAEKLYAVNKEIHDMTEKVKEQIEKLKEYRQSLIYEAVTGKIDVSDMEID